MSAQAGDLLLFVIVPVLAFVWLAALIARIVVGRQREPLQSRWLREAGSSANDPRFTSEPHASPDSDSMGQSTWTQTAANRREKITGTAQCRTP